MKGLHTTLEHVISKQAFVMRIWFYVVDVITLGGRSQHNVIGILRIFHAFIWAYDLKINFQKISSWELDEFQWHWWDNILLGILLSSSIVCNLVFPLQLICCSWRGWKPINDKFTAKISNWKVKTLSAGVRTRIRLRRDNVRKFKP